MIWFPCMWLHCIAPNQIKIQNDFVLVSNLVCLASKLNFWNIYYCEKNLIWNICFFRITQYNVETHNMHAHSPIWTHVHKPYPYEHLRRTEPANLEINEVTTGTSLSTGTSPTIEIIVPLNPIINLEKYEHTCQVKNLNPDGQVPP